MEILSEQNFINTLRKLCDKVNHRLWIASPYIGSLKSVTRILGAKWLKSSGVGVRLITDLGELSKLSTDTIRAFENRGIVKSLRGLHAKIYIIDDNVILTSANLTPTAFSRRYEVGCLLKRSDARKARKLYESWWNEKAKDFPFEWWNDLDKGAGDENLEEDEGMDLPELWKLPKSPNINMELTSSNGFLDYTSFCKRYSELKSIYEEVQRERIEEDIPLNFEIDGFLDYLFHHDGKPSIKYGNLKGQDIIEPRSLNKSERKKEIKKYARKFKKWVEISGYDIRRRLEKSELIRSRLEDEEIISTISRSDVEDVADQLNCMRSMRINYVKFVNPKNNHLNTIRKAWNILLHGEDDLQVRMTKCKEMLQSFGKSSVQELLGFYYPEKYPIRNSNVNAGLRFFGYDVSLD